MTRAQVLERLMDEIDVLWPGERDGVAASVDDLDALWVAIDTALYACEEFIEDQFSRARGQDS